MNIRIATLLGPVALATAVQATLTASTTHAVELNSTSPPPPPAWHYGSSVLEPQRAIPSEAEELVLDGTESITERYPNRAVKIQRTVKQDAERNYINHGPWIMYDPQGQVLAQGTYREGQRHGPWMQMLASFPAVESTFQAPFHSQAEFEDGQLNGTWTILDREQRVVGSWQFNQGELEGESTVFFPNGQQRQTMTFRQGQPDGEALAWRQDGQVWSREYYRDGKQLVPVVTHYDEQQKKTEGWLLRSNFVIKANIDWWEGALEIAREPAEGEDVRIGTWREWFANGTLRYEGTFENGDPVGEHLWWHTNGQKQLVGNFDRGLREGLWTHWHQNGHKFEEGEYLAGVKQGVWTLWDADGQVAEVQHLNDDLETTELPVSIED